MFIGHKWFNVPYASGIFYTRSLELLKSVFGPSPRYPPPAYLTPVNFDAPSELPTSREEVPSPLHTNLENSRRFIALPLFAGLLSLGRRGYADLVERNVQFARRVAKWMDDEEGRRWYEVLNLTHQGRWPEDGPTQYCLIPRATRSGTCDLSPSGTWTGAIMQGGQYN